MKKFSDKYLNNFNILNNAVVGFEFEFYTEKPYYKLLELLNRELGVKVTGYRVYHSSFEPTETNWKIEPDLSLGQSGVELISGPIPYINAKVYLLKALKILQRSDFSTNDKCSIHINISFDKEKSDYTLDDLNRLKMILNVDEELVYKYFPVRENNFYAKSVKRLIPFKNYDFSNAAAELLVNSLELPDTKYYGINLLNVFDGRIEFRYIGGEKYEEKTGEILELLDYFILLSWNCMTEPLDDEDMDKLKMYLAENINQFKNFTKLDNFIAEFPSIDLQIDMQNGLLILRTYYEQFYEQLYDLITNIYNLSNCIINFNTENQKLEIVDATFKAIFDIKNIDIIDSNISGGAFSNCTIINSEVKNCQLTNCKLYDCDVYDTKVESTVINDGCILNDCYVFNSLLNGHMKGGVFRSGKLGEYAELDKNVNIVSSINNYFNPNKKSDIEDKMKSVGDFKNKSLVKNKWMNGYNNTKTKLPGNETTF